MRHPGFVTALMGHPIIAYPLCLAALGAVGLAFSGGLSPLWVALTLGAAYAAMRANERMRTYQAWQREWDRMAGPPHGRG